MADFATGQSGALPNTFYHEKPSCKVSGKILAISDQNSQILQLTVFGDRVPLESGKPVAASLLNS